MYAYFKKLDYFSTECIYSPNAYRFDLRIDLRSEFKLILLLRGYARAYIKDVEKIRATAIIDIIHSGEQVLLAFPMNYVVLSHDKKDMGTLWYAS